MIRTPVVRLVLALVEESIIFGPDLTGQFAHVDFLYVTWIQAFGEIEFS